MKFYWLVLLLIVFVNVLFLLFCVDKFAHSMMEGGFDVYSMIFSASFLAVLGFAFLFMLQDAEKSLLI
jgi:hypothetical protein